MAKIDISAILKDARDRKNMSQYELAKRSGVRQSNISRIENGNCSANVSTLEALASGLGLELVIRFEDEKGEKNKD